MEAGAGRTDAGWRWFALAAALSLVTMPVTAIWFLGVGGLVTGFASARSLIRGEAALSVVHQVGLGLLVGPAVYLLLAVLD